MLLAIILISYMIVIVISSELPVSYYVNKCNDAREYYNTTRIINYSILYSITTYNNKTNLFSTETILYNNPTFENYLNLFTYNTNITLYGKIIFEYEILSPCYYKCAMDITSNEYTSKTIAKHLETYYQPGRTYPMMCNSYGCHTGFGSNYCETFHSHDEL